MRIINKLTSHETLNYTDPFSGRYPQRVFLDMEATCFTNIPHKLQVSSTLTSAHFFVAELLRKVPVATEKDKEGRRIRRPEWKNSHWSKPPQNKTAPMVEVPVLGLLEHRCRERLHPVDGKQPAIASKQTTIRAEVFQGRARTKSLRQHHRHTESTCGTTNAAARSPLYSG